MNNSPTQNITPLSTEKQNMLNHVADHLEQYLQDGKHPLRPKQIKAFQDIIDGARNGQWGGSIIRPTGTGKTIIFSAVIHALQGLQYELEQKNEVGDEHGFLILVPTNYLAEQTRKTMVSAQREHGKPLFGFAEEDVAIVNADSTAQQKRDGFSAPNLIMTYQYFDSLNKRDQEKLHARFFTIMDEVDVAKGEKRSPLFHGWTKDNYTLGFSATEKFIDKNEIKSINDELFEGRPSLHQTTIAEAARECEIAPIRNVLFVTELDSGIERSVRGKKREYTQKELTSIVNQVGRDDAAIKSIATFKDPNNGIAFKDLNQIWFCMGVEHAQRIADRLNHVYHETLPDGTSRYPFGYAVAVSGETPKEDWVDDKQQPHLGLYSILEKHRNGEIPVICNADLLVRGFDSPSTQLCVMLRPTRSPALTEQAGGRIGRLDAKNSNKLGYVATFFDRDTESAMCFTDVTGSVFTGVEGQETNQSFCSGTGEMRHPDMDVLQSEKPVEVITKFEPREIKDFLKKIRTPKSSKHPMPDNFVTAKMMAREQGLPDKYYDKEPLRTLYDFHRNPQDNHFFVNPRTQQKIHIPMDAIAVFDPPHGMGGTQLCVRRDIAEKIFTREGKYPRLPAGFVDLEDAQKTLNPARYKAENQSIRDFYMRLTDVLHSYEEQQQPLPAAITIGYENAKVTIPSNTIGRFDVSPNYTTQGWYSTAIRHEYLPHLKTLLELIHRKEEAPEDHTCLELLNKIKDFKPDLPSDEAKILVRKPEDTIDMYRHTAMQNTIAANGSNRIQHRILTDHRLCGSLVQRIEAAWKMHQKYQAEHPEDTTETFMIPIGDFTNLRDVVSLNMQDIGYFRHEETGKIHPFITRSALAHFTRALDAPKEKPAPHIMDWSLIPLSPPPSLAPLPEEKLPVSVPTLPSPNTSITTEGVDIDPMQMLQRGHWMKPAR